MKANTRTMIGSAALGVVMMFGSVGISPTAVQDTLAGAAGQMKRDTRSVAV